MGYRVIFLTKGCKLSVKDATGWMLLKCTNKDLKQTNRKMAVSDFLF